MLFYDGRVIRSSVKIKGMVVRFSIRPEFARAKVQRDVEEVGSYHVGFSGYLQAVLLKGFQNIFSCSFNSRSWCVTDDRLTIVSVEAHDIAGYFVGELVQDK